MKIAILTQPLGHNYGGIMQAYALQKILRDLGHDVTTIDRRAGKKNFIKILLLPFKPVIYKLLGKKNIPILSPSQSKYIYSGMTDFIHKNIQMSEFIDNTADLKTHHKKKSYDLVIVGSDQVWRPKYSPNIYNFFVDFLEEGDKRISYAASFGVDDWEFDEAQTEHCKNLIQKFQAVSVRESSAIELCKEKLGVDAQLVLDPTLLLKAEDYEKLLVGRKPKGKGKVLKYILDDNENKKELVGRVAKYLRKPVFTAQPTKRLIDVSRDDLEACKYLAVEEWIMSFRDADFVITDSFHGCVFSIIFNKSFIAIGNCERGLSRFQSLLSALDLMDRLVMNEDKITQDLLEQETDWASVNSKLRAYQESSISFLTTWV